MAHWSTCLRLVPESASEGKRICQHTGHWDGQEPRCERVMDPYTALEHGSIRVELPEPEGSNSFLFLQTAIRSRLI